MIGKTDQTSTAECRSGETAPPSQDFVVGRAAALSTRRLLASAIERVRALAVESYVAADCEGMARVDLFVRDGDVLVNELNTIPGFTSTSVYAKLFAASGVPYPELLDRLLNLALARHARERAYSY